MPVLRKAAAPGSNTRSSSALPPIQPRRAAAQTPGGMCRKAARTPNAAPAAAAGRSSETAFSASGCGNTAMSADRSTRRRDDPPAPKRTTTTTFAPTTAKASSPADPFERSAKDRWSSGLGNALAAVRTKDEVQRVIKKEFPLPPVPFGPTTPFRRVRALLGDSQPHLTDPVVAQRHQQQQRDAAAATKASPGGPAASGRAHHRRGSTSAAAVGKETSSDEDGSEEGALGGDGDDTDSDDDFFGASSSMDLSSLVPGGGGALGRKPSVSFNADASGPPAFATSATASSSRYVESRSVARRRRRRAAAEGGRGTKLPSGLEVATMPSALGDGIRSVAVARLAQLFYPRLLLRRARRRLVADTTSAQRHAVKVTAEMLKKEQLFADWPAEAMARLISGLTLSCSRDTRQLLYAGEPAGSVIVFVTSGSIEYVAAPSVGAGGGDDFAVRLMTPPTSRRQQQRKPRPAAPAVVLKRFHAPAVINEFTFLTWEPRLSTVRVSPRAEVWTLDRHAFNAALSALPKEIAAAVNERARAKRLRDVMRLFPLTPAVLGRHGALSECSSAFLSALCTIMRPMCVGPGHFFSASDLHDLPPGVPQPSALSLVLRGTVGQFRLLAAGSGGSFSMAGGGASRRMSMMLRRGSNAARSPNTNSNNAASSSMPTSETAKHRPDAVLIGERSAPLVLNEHLALLRSPAPVVGEVFEAVSACDGYCADADAVERLLATHPNDRAAVASHSQRQQQKIATAQMAQHRALLTRIPFIGCRLGPDALRALSLLFDARVYAPLTVICSASQQADRVMILTKGSATVEHPGQPNRQQRKRRWAPHEAIGYTSVAPHRWAASVVAVETCEVIELPRPALVAFLRDTGLFNDAVAAAKCLMFPNAEPLPGTTEIAEVAHAEEARRQTPALHPVFEEAVDFSSAKAGLIPMATGDHAPTAVMGGLSAGVLPTAHRLSRDERDAIEADVVARYRPGNARHTVKVTDFLYVKHRAD